MAFMLSPGITIVEKDIPTIVPAVSTSVGGMAGSFSWGPVEDPIRISSENELVRVFGYPNDDNFQSFFTAANFLSYSNNLWVCRTSADGLRNAVEKQNDVSPADSVLIKNLNDYVNNGYIEGGGSEFGCFAAKYPGIKGNGLKIVVLDSGAWAELVTRSEAVSIPPGVSSDDAKYAKKLMAIFGNGPNTSDYASKYGIKDDEIHIAIFDTKSGTFSGVVDQDQLIPLEVYKYVSKLTDAKSSDGSTNYYKNVLNNNSQYVWWLSDPIITATGVNWSKSTDWMLKNGEDTFKVLGDELKIILAHGVDDSEMKSSDIQTAYDIYKNAESYDISLLMTGNISQPDAHYIVENIAELRKDCMVFISPNNELQPITGIGSVPIVDIINFRNGKYKTTTIGRPINSSYAVMDTGWKYQYDRYNDTYRWVPLNGDIAGVCARTDDVADPWFSPAGLNRGGIKNLIRLGVNPDKTARDTLYNTNNINPVVTLPGQGTVLYGDKTLLTKPSAFDRINVRRLFIILEKAIALAARYQLFEFNDEFTRSQFRNIVEPYLRDVQGRRGLYDFKVVCDETVNTPEVIDRNEFIGSIYIKPAKSINFMTLNFVAVRTGISFEEIT